MHHHFSEKSKKLEEQIYLKQLICSVHWTLSIQTYLNSVCVCVCVCERERERPPLSQEHQFELQCSISHCLNPARNDGGRHIIKG